MKGMIITKKLLSIFLTLLICATGICIPISAEDSDYYEVKIPKDFEIISQFSNGSCFVNREHEYGLLSTDGDYVLLTKINGYAPSYDITVLDAKPYVELYDQRFIEDWGWDPSEDELSFNSIYLFKNGERYSELTPTQNNNYIVKNDNGYGILDSDGKEIVECKYHYIESDFSDGLLPVAVEYDDQQYTFDWKYLKQDGAYLNDNVYLSATPFYGGYANVTFEDDGKIMHGILNTDGELVYSAENNYDYITQFYGNCAFGFSYELQEDAQDYQGKIEVFDSSGTVRDTVYSNSGNLPTPVVVIDDLLQYLLSDTIEYNFDLVQIPVEEYDVSIDSVSSQYMLYNTKDFVLYEEVYSEVSPQVNGYIVVADLDGNYGYVDENGQEVIECQYAYANDFFEGLASVSTDGESFFYINEDGEIADIGTFAYAGNFSDGAAPVANEDELFGLIDTNGQMILDYEYYLITTFINSIAMVVDTEEKFGLIDTEGNFIVPCEYDMAIPIGSDMYPIVAKLDDLEEVISLYSVDQSGNKLIDADYDIILSLGEGMVLCGNTEDEKPILYRTQISDSTQKILDFKSTLAELPETLTDDDIEQIDSVMEEYEGLNYQEQQALYSYPEFWKVRKYFAAKEIDDDRLIGDIDEDGRVSVIDIISARGIITENIRYTPKQELLADVNGDGSVSVVDVVALRKIIMG